MAWVRALNKTTSVYEGNPMPLKYTWHLLNTYGGKYEAMCSPRRIVSKIECEALPVGDSDNRVCGHCSGRFEYERRKLIDEQ